MTNKYSMPNLTQQVALHNTYNLSYAFFFIIVSSSIIICIIIYYYILLYND